VVEDLPLIERVQERREGPRVECARSVAQEVIADAGQFGENRADVLAARRDVDIEQFFDRVVPGDVVRQGRDVIHPVGDGDVLIVIQMLADLFEPAVQITDVGARVDDLLPFDLQNEPQRGMRRRMLRPEIEGPAVFLFDGSGGFEGGGHLNSFK
jgi:hypothetical protein